MGAIEPIAIPTRVTPSAGRLALFGGSPVVTRQGTHFPWPPLTPDIEQAILRQTHTAISIYDRSGVFEQFETVFARYHGRRRALVTSSGTAAIHSAFVALNLGPNDEVIVPAYTFHASVSPIFFTGAVPVLADCDATGNIDPHQIEQLVTTRTRAVVVTHMWGVPCAMNAVAQICRSRGIQLIEDCSHAHGARIHSRPVGSWGDISAWSLQGPKIISGGEGGILLTDSDDLYYRTLLFGHYNKRCKQEIPHSHPLARFAVTGMGLKLRAHPLAIAMTHEHFGHLDDWLAQKRALASMLTRRLAALPGIRVPVVPPDAEPAWYAYVLHYHPEELEGLPIERFFAALQAEGCVEADRPASTCPLSLLPLYQDPAPLFPAYVNRVQYHPGDFPVAEGFFESAVKLPVGALASDEPLMARYCDAIEKVIEHYKDLL